MTQLESQLQSSITYRKLVNKIEAIAQGSTYVNNFSGETKFSPEAKVEMTRLIADSVGEAVREYTLRCAECDKRIDPICEECAS